MSEYEKNQSRYSSIDPSSILLGPKAIRNANGNVGISKSTSSFIANVSLNKQKPIDTDTVLKDIPIKGKLTQPRHKLPLKMVLSEVARRGNDLLSATLPNTNQQPQAAYSINDILSSRPSQEVCQKSRFELLTDAKYILGMKQPKKKSRARGSIDLGRLQADERREDSYSKVYTNKSSNQSTTFTSEENPLTPIYDLSSRLSNHSASYASMGKSNFVPVCPPMHSNYDSSKIFSQSSNSLSKHTPKERHSKDTSYVDTFSTPFAIARFQNLYGDSIGNFNSQYYQSMSDKPKQSQMTFVNDEEPIPTFQSRCNNKVTTRPTLSQATSSIDDVLLSHPSKEVCKETKCELLIDAKHLGKKQTMKNSHVRGTLQANEEKEHFYSKLCRNDSDKNTTFTSDENPLTPIYEVSSGLCSNSPTYGSISRSNHVCPPMHCNNNNSCRAFNQSSNSPWEHTPDESKNTSYIDTFSTPFARSRFQNLYGDSISNVGIQCYQSGEPKHSEMPYMHDGEPIADRQSRYKNKVTTNSSSLGKSSGHSFSPILSVPADQMQRTNKAISHIHDKEFEISDNEEKFESDMTSYTKSITGRSKENISNGKKRKHGDENGFVWKPQNLISQRKCPWNIIMENNQYHDGVNYKELENENLNIHTSNYSYERIEFEYDVNVGSDSQGD